MAIINHQNQNTPSNLPGSQQAVAVNGQADRAANTRPLSVLNSPVPDLRVAANQTQSIENIPVQAAGVRIIPGLPDQNSGKIYRLQVGVYSAVEAANRAAEIVEMTGLNAVKEYYGSTYRVMAEGIAAVDVYQASVRLGSVGFSQILVRE